MIMEDRYKVLAFSRGLVISRSARVYLAFVWKFFLCSWRSLRQKISEIYYESAIEILNSLFGCGAYNGLNEAKKENEPNEKKLITT